MKRPNCPRCGKRMQGNGKTPGGRVRLKCDQKNGGCGYSTTNPDVGVRNQRGDVKTRQAPVFAWKRGTAKRYIVTAAQNATPVHEGFLRALERAAQHLDAEIIVIPIRYKNPTSRWSASQANEETWDPEIVPYLVNQRIKLNRNLVVLGDVKVQPTAISPLTGFEGITHGESGIFGHTKLQLKTVPTPQNKLPKILTTTGAITVPNYTDSKAGKLGEFHHTLGAALVEIDRHRFHLRQLNAEADGSFYDLDTYYAPGSITPGRKAAALVMGDTHVDFIDLDVERATFGKGGVVERLDPEYLVWNDVLDAYSCNHHHRGNPFIAHAKMKANRTNVQEEIERAARFVARYSAGRKSIIVPSNHNDFVVKWILGTDWRFDVGNARFYLETALAMLDGAKLTTQGAEYPDPTAHWLRRLLPAGCTVLDRGDSFVVADVEVGMHGDIGPHGSRGSLRNLRRIGVRSVIGHSHAPGIDEGAVQVGTSTELVLEYSRGAPSGWLNTHCVIYPNGKRSLINIIGGKWTL